MTEVDLGSDLFALGDVVRREIDGVSLVLSGHTFAGGGACRFFVGDAFKTGVESLRTA